MSFFSRSKKFFSTSRLLTGFFLKNLLWKGHLTWDLSLNKILNVQYIFLFYPTCMFSFINYFLSLKWLHMNFQFYNNAIIYISWLSNGKLTYPKCTTLFIYWRFYLVLCLGFLHLYLWVKLTYMLVFLYFPPQLSVSGVWNWAGKYFFFLSSGKVFMRLKPFILEHLRAYHMKLEFAHPLGRSIPCSS